MACSNVIFSCMEKDYNAARCAAGKGSADGAARIKGGYSLSAEREYPPLHPPRERALIGSFGLERLLCLRSGTACARRCRVRTARRFASASIIRCRSADLVEVQTNFRLPRHSSMRRAPAMPHSASSLPPSNRHSRLTIVRRGCNRCRIAGIHGEAMYTALTLRSACSSSRSRLPMCGVEGQSPSRSLGGQRGPFSHAREWPPLLASLRGAKDLRPHAAGHTSKVI